MTTSPAPSPLAELPTGMAMWGGWYDYVIPFGGATIAARPQRAAFRPERLVIRRGEDWLIHDIRVGRRSQLVGTLPLPGALFDPARAAQMDMQLALDTCQASMDLSITVEYIGAEPNGEAFYASFIGIAEGIAGRTGREVLPLSSSGPVAPSGPYGKRAVVDLDGVRWRVEETSGRIMAVVRDPADFAPPEHARPGEQHAFEEPRAVSLHLVAEAGDLVWQAVDEATDAVLFRVWKNGHMGCDPDGLDV